MWSHVWHVGVGELFFDHQVSIVWQHWWHSRSQISHEPSHILLTSAWVCRGLGGPTCSECLPEETCHFEPPEHVPRTSASAQICARGPCGFPACRGAESTRKRPAARRAKKCRSAKKEHSYSKVHIIVIWYNITYVCMHTWYSISSEVARKQRITFWSLWLPSLPDDNPFLQNTRLGSLLHLAARLSWSSNEFGPRGLSCRRPLLGDRPSRQCSGSLTSGRISSVIRRLHYNFDTIIWLCSSSQTWHILFTLFDGKRSGAVSIFV